MAAQDVDAVALLMIRLRNGFAELSEATIEEQAVVIGGLVRRVKLSKEKAEVELITPGGATLVMHSHAKWLPCMDSNHD